MLCVLLRWRIVFACTWPNFASPLVSVPWCPCWSNRSLLIQANLCDHVWSTNGERAHLLDWTSLGPPDDPSSVGYWKSHLRELLAALSDRTGAGHRIKSCWYFTGGRDFALV